MNYAIVAGLATLLVATLLAPAIVVSHTVSTVLFIALVWNVYSIWGVHINKLLKAGGERVRTAAQAAKPSEERSSSGPENQDQPAA